MFAWPATNLDLVYVLTCPCGVEHRAEFKIKSPYSDIPAAPAPAGWTVVDGVAWCPLHVFESRDAVKIIVRPEKLGEVPVLNPDEDWHPPLIPRERAHAHRPGLR